MTKVIKLSGDVSLNVFTYCGKSDSVSKIPPRHGGY